MSHVSFSELKIWNECPWKHKSVYIDKIKGFEGNEHTAFGSAVHSVCENKILNESLNEKEHFKEQFLEELKALPQEVRDNLNKKLVHAMKDQGVMLAPLIIPALKEHFKSFEVVSVEEKLYEPIKDFVDSDKEFMFKGFIDLVIKTDDGKHHIIDWKTCSWGWDSRKKSERMITYQLVFYKYYYALKHNVDPQDIETHFALLKRTAKHNNVEIFRVTSGKKKTENALKLLKKALYNINNKFYVKNRLACHGKFGQCEFYRTKHCT
jgi:ATP-dependent exoDNAse (exonuclease V) beta subunit